MPDTPPPPPGIDEKIAEAVANEDYELAARLKKMKESPPPPPKKGKAPPPKKAPPKGKPKRRRRRLKLRMKSKEISTEEDNYTDTIGWNTAMGTVLEEEIETVEEPRTITHQCSMCGSIMTIPKPKRERYRIVCSHPMCGHADSVGF